MVSVYALRSFLSARARTRGEDATRRARRRLCDVSVRRSIRRWYSQRRRSKRATRRARGLKLGQAVALVQDDEAVAFLVGHLVTGVLEVNHLVARLQGHRLDFFVFFARLARPDGDDGADDGLLLGPLRE